MENIIELIAKSLVDDPDSVIVRAKADGETIVYELSVASDDTGKVIGKQGQIAKAIRTVVKAMAARENKKVIVKII